MTDKTAGSARGSFSCAARRLIVSGGLLALAACLSAAPPDSKTTFDGGKAYEHMRQMVSYGPRPAGSSALAETRAYITRELSAIGLQVQEQAFDADTPIGRLHMVNLIATIKGRDRDRILITGHYDTKLFKEFRFVSASDGASSAAFLIEMARVLSKRQNPYTMELIWLDGEEAVRHEWADQDHTYGSRHYVDQARQKGTLANLRAMILVDMIGDRDLTIQREDNSTAWLTDAVWDAARKLGHTDAFQDGSLRTEDDHIPFLEAGVPSVDIIDFQYPPWHTEADTLEQVSARSLETVGNVLLEALPAIEKRLAANSKD
jgi:Zn-dependent M28 family amino/carboxypeptidase